MLCTRAVLWDQACYCMSISLCLVRMCGLLFPRVWERQQRNTSLCRSYCNCKTTSLQKKSVSPVQSFLVVWRLTISRLAERICLTRHLEGGFPNHPNVHPIPSSCALRPELARCLEDHFCVMLIWIGIIWEVAEIEPDWYRCPSALAWVLDMQSECMEASVALPLSDVKIQHWSRGKQYVAGSKEGFEGLLILRIPSVDFFACQKQKPALQSESFGLNRSASWPRAEQEESAEWSENCCIQNFQDISVVNWNISQGRGKNQTGVVPPNFDVALSHCICPRGFSCSSHQFLTFLKEVFCPRRKRKGLFYILLLPLAFAMVTFLLASSECPRGAAMNGVKGEESKAWLCVAAVDTSEPPSLAWIWKESSQRALLSEMFTKEQVK